MKRLMTLANLWNRPKPAVGMTPKDAVHHENKLTLYRYRERPQGLASKTPVLLVPSLINRHYVLDLMPGKSFTEYLVNAGHEVYTIDWGTPGPEDRYLTFDEIIDGYIRRAMHKVSMRAEGRPVHVMGYCLGGTLATILAATRPERFASLAAVAAPVKFEDDGLLSKWTRTPTFDVTAMVEAFGNTPWQLMQSAFHMLRPTLSLSKAVYFLEKCWDDEFVDGFLALETWGNDNVSFPGEAYKRYVEELYRKDALISGELSVAGRRADLKNVTCPTLAVTFEHDNIVPKDSAAVLLERVGAEDRQHIHLGGGHVGAMVSKSAAKHLWPKMSAFWFTRQADAPDVKGSVDPKVPTPAPTARGARATEPSRRPEGVA